MKVIVAMDSFKGCLSSAEVGTSVKEGILAAMPEASVAVLPIADGGEGTIDVFLSLPGAEAVELSVTGPLGERVCAKYALLADGTAVIEAAQAIGLPLLTPERRDPLLTGTCGVGELMLDALNRGCRSFILGIGGSATNDGGIGMLTALGARFTDKDGNAVPPCGGTLSKVAHADFSGLDSRFSDCRIRVACDVNNPLCGPRGASAVFGPQKGADEACVRLLDEGLRHYAEVITACGGADIAEEPGAGAAGGLGYALRLLPGATLETGAALLAQAAGLPEMLKNADILVTGEGRIDFQTGHGKCPAALSAMAKQYGASVIALGGSVSVTDNAVFDAVFSIPAAPSALEEAMKPETAAANLRRTAEQVFRSIALGGRL